MDDKTRQFCWDHLLGGFLGAVGAFLASVCLFLLVWFSGSVDMPASYRKAVSTYAVLRDQPRFRLFSMYEVDYGTAVVRDNQVIPVSSAEKILRFGCLSEEPMPLDGVLAIVHLPPEIEVVKDDEGKKSKIGKGGWEGPAQFGRQETTQYEWKVNEVIRPNLVKGLPNLTVRFPHPGKYRFEYHFHCLGFSEWAVIPFFLEYRPNPVGSEQ